MKMLQVSDKVHRALKLRAAQTGTSIKEMVEQLVLGSEPGNADISDNRAAWMELKKRLEKEYGCIFDREFNVIEVTDQERFAKSGLVLPDRDYNDLSSKIQERIKNED